MSFVRLAARSGNCLPIVKKSANLISTNIFDTQFPSSGSIYEQNYIAVTLVSWPLVSKHDSKLDFLCRKFPCDLVSGLLNDVESGEKWQTKQMIKKMLQDENLVKKSVHKFQKIRSEQYNHCIHGHLCMSEAIRLLLVLENPSISNLTSWSSTGLVKKSLCLYTEKYAVIIEGGVSFWQERQLLQKSNVFSSTKLWMKNELTLLLNLNFWTYDE